MTIDNTHTLEDIERIIDTIKQKTYFSRNTNKIKLEQDLIRNDKQIFEDDKFHNYTDEQTLSRYLYNLGQKDYSMQNGISMTISIIKHEILV